MVSKLAIFAQKGAKIALRKDYFYIWEFVNKPISIVRELAGGGCVSVAVGC